jgi:hypothetical protein
MEEEGCNRALCQHKLALVYMSSCVEDTSSTNVRGLARFIVANQKKHSLDPTVLRQTHSVLVGCPSTEFLSFYRRFTFGKLKEKQHLPVNYDIIFLR